MATILVVDDQADNLYVLERLLKGRGYTVLTAADGNAVQSVTFPFDDTATPIKPDRIFFAGTMYKKLQ